ncbi:MAG: hypothetical protein O3B01_05145 [Planctomycetota bacterium]|nr:hypothetical protein [Planctomycetota bacterium]MDA1137946.1 hypothetical protein [Planctomycetota bacterium]
MKTRTSLTILVLFAASGLPCQADYKMGPRKLIQAYYTHLYESYKPEFKFSEGRDRELIAAGAVAYIFLAGHRDEFQGNELASPIIRKSIQGVKAAQSPDGSFGENEAGPDRVNPTAIAVLALTAASNPDYSPLIQKAESWLRNLNDDRLDVSGRFLKLLALNKGTISAQSALPVLALLLEMKSDNTPEVQALTLLGSALIREFSEGGGVIEKNKLEQIPQWDALTDQATKSLSGFIANKQVSGACIAVRTLHSCMYAQKRKK